MELFYGVIPTVSFGKHKYLSFPLHFIGRVNTACVVLKDTSFISSYMYIEFVLPLIDFRCNGHLNVKGGGQKFPLSSL